MEIMAKKSILDEIIESDSNQSYDNENEILKPLLDEIELIEDESIKSFVRSCLIKAKSFWIVPSSFSGKYHPPDEHGPGGNVLHTKRVVRVANSMCESHSVINEERDVVLAACLLHDVTKGIENSSSENFEYDPMHPYTVGAFVSKCVDHDKEYGTDDCSSCLFLSEEAVNTILRLVRCHLGPWSPVPETFPITYLDYIVHVADNIASKIHLYIQDSELMNEKWRLT
jgi:hypothetical protein